MKTFVTTVLVAGLGFAALGFTATTRADDDIGPDEALRLVQAGSIKSFEELNAIAQALQPGATIEDTELELERGRYVYQVELRGSAPGEEWDVEIDAVTGTVLSAHRDD